MGKFSTKLMEKRLYFSRADCTKLTTAHLDQDKTYNAS